MKVGLKLGAQGADVERLQRVLTSAGLRIAAGEIKRRKFGPSTLKALHFFLSQRGLPARDKIDAATYAMLLAIEGNTTININESAPPVTPPTPNPNQGDVQGTLVDRKSTRLNSSH